jgi:hypothetical protein
LQAIKHTLDRMTVKLYDLINKELQLVKNDLSKKTCQVASHVPQKAGQAHWAHCLRRRIQSTMEVSP